VKKDEVRGWTLSAADTGRPNPAPKQVPSHIMTGKACNYGDNVAFTRRVRVAHTLAELKAKVADGRGITVAQTLGSEEAQEEVLDYAVKH